MELRLNISKFLVLDTPFSPEMLDDNQAVLGTVDGKQVMMVCVGLDEITKQIQEKKGER
jgi:hypothetical protein